MLIDLWHTVVNYVYEVFYLKLDLWDGIGAIAQVLFTARFVLQLIASERAGRSVFPLAFWFFSIGGGVLLLVYAIVKKNPVYILAQAFSVWVYARNLMLEFRERERRASAGGQELK
jgi:lipid-A-disaccharide synthase-like uncharacterized protein